jgi:hypothetical protein
MAHLVIAKNLQTPKTTRRANCNQRIPWVCQAELPRHGKFAQYTCFAKLPVR